MRLPSASSLYMRCILAAEVSRLKDKGKVVVEGAVRGWN